MMERRGYSELKSACEEAAEWFILLNSGELDRVQRRAYLHWLTRSARNMTEALRISQLHGVLRASLDPKRAGLFD